MKRQGKRNDSGTTRDDSSRANDDLRGALQSTVEQQQLKIYSRVLAIANNVEQRLGKKSELWFVCRFKDPMKSSCSFRKIKNITPVLSAL